MPERPGSLAEALVTLQTRLPRITKDATADTGKYTYSYANLASISDAILPLLAELGLYWICKPTMADGQFVLRYKLGHAPTGEYEEGDYPLPSATPQTQGGAITYARRYSLCAVLGIAPAEDDDDAASAEQEAAATKGSQWMPPANPRTRKAQRSRNTADEDTAWNTPEAENLPGSIDPKQLQQIGILFGNIGVTDRGDRLALVTKYLNLTATPGSSKELSMAQGTQLIDRLQKEAAAK